MSQLLFRVFKNRRCGLTLEGVIQHTGTRAYVGMLSVVRVVVCLVYAARALYWDTVRFCECPPVLIHVSGCDMTIVLDVPQYIKSLKACIFKNETYVANNSTLFSHVHCAHLLLRLKSLLAQISGVRHTFCNKINDFS